VPAEVALWYGVNLQTVYLWCQQGKVFAVQPDGSKTWLISTRSVWDWRGIPDCLSGISVDNNDLFAET
jgi:hypothetical protein